MGYNELGHAFERHSVNDSAFYYFFLSKNIFLRLNNPEGEANTLFYIGDLHEIMGRFDSAAFYLYQSLQLADSINNTDLEAKNHRVIGNMLLKQNRMDEALRYYISSLRLFKIKND
jgi:tetratricopeptide (TPR) repeat protein